jgi:hypothetical protein
VDSKNNKINDDLIEYSQLGQNGAAMHDDGCKDQCQQQPVSALPD